MDKKRSEAFRAGRAGFVVGVVIFLPAIIFALLVPIGEDLLPFLTFGSLLLAPLADRMTTWPGALTIGLGALANGLAFSVLAGAGAVVIRAVRGRRETPVDG